MTETDITAAHDRRRFLVLMGSVSLLVVSGGGMIGFAALFALERLIDGDITALEQIAVDAPLAE